MEASFTRVITNSYPELQDMLGAIASFLDGITVSAASSRKVRLVIEELLTNIIKYGYDKASRETIELTIYQNRKSLRIELKDKAREFDPTASRKKSEVDSIENLKIGGLGLIIVRKLCRRMKYRRVKNENFLSITLPVEFVKK